MIDIKEKYKCSGCGACFAVCPVTAIEMKFDREGFKYPIVDSDKCIGCNLCSKTCPIENFDFKHKDVSSQISTHAFKSFSDKRLDSSSGGVFYELSNEFLDSGGLVVGAAFDQNFNLCHRIIDNIDDIKPLMGSKYVQSDTYEVFKEIKEVITAGKKVLYFGLTCQIEGLIKYIGNDSNLFTIDLICMGVPSPKIWTLYLDTFFERSNIEYVNYKDKRLGWHKFSFVLKEKNKTEFFQEGFDNYYMECMFKGYTLRPSCYKCVFKCENKKSDLTIADCWGCEDYLPEIDDNKGISMIISHSEKGENLLSFLKNKGEIIAFDYSNVLKYNSHYNNCAEIKGNRTLFFAFVSKYPRVTFSLLGKNPNKSLVGKMFRKFKI